MKFYLVIFSMIVFSGCTIVVNQGEKTVKSRSVDDYKSMEQTKMIISMFEIMEDWPREEDFSESKRNLMDEYYSSGENLSIAKTNLIAYRQQVEDEEVRKDRSYYGTPKEREKIISDINKLIADYNFQEHCDYNSLSLYHLGLKKQLLISQSKIKVFNERGKK